MPKRRDLRGVGRDRHEVLGDGRRRRRVFSISHSRADVALVNVSNVPKVFEETMKSVSSASKSRSASTRSVESTFETKRKLRSRRE